MKRKLLIITGFAGALALSIGFAKDFENTKVFAQTNGDQFKHVTREEQNYREGNTADGKDITTTITVEEQEMVENSSAQQGFVPQENGTGFYFEKQKK
ncbi:hypothetical protein CN326_21155 [Bacillus sp. AFS018417]|uniref:hypothetical protein n=1 Tax=Bacillus sp. AFS018417 TaxID=2033491 RepID=UPI000BF27B19|nr:hypothetical protein [Bacillus sp. AFS018417]PEZ01494.1 hypothetical protein CN326_21155 [Bacillus sp. AFS018417]